MLIGMHLCAPQCFNMARALWRGEKKGLHRALSYFFPVLSFSIVMQGLFCTCCSFCLEKGFCAVAFSCSPCGLCSEWPAAAVLPASWMTVPRATPHTVRSARPIGLWGKGRTRATAAAACTGFRLRKCSFSKTVAVLTLSAVHAAPSADAVSSPASTLFSDFTALSLAQRRKVSAPRTQSDAAGHSLRARVPTPNVLSGKPERTQMMQGALAAARSRPLSSWAHGEGSRATMSPSCDSWAWEIEGAHSRKHPTL